MNVWSSRHVFTNVSLFCFKAFSKLDIHNQYVLFVKNKDNIIIIIIMLLIM